MVHYAHAFNSINFVKLILFSLAKGHRILINKIRVIVNHLTTLERSINRKLAAARENNHKNNA